ncbi:MAG: MerR family DNA-binding transcriptional regulator [Acidobacteriia bacterium]|nr:MerR family DNA-binding transcriptional regulator [Terriglobia bacterium]
MMQTSGKVAERSGVSRDAIRYYERRPGRASRAPTGQKRLDPRVDSRV